MERLYIKLKGRTPLLMNNPKETLSKGEEGVTRGRVKQPAPDEQARLRRYVLPDGSLYVSAEAVRKALLTASRGYTVRGETGRRTALQPVLAGAILLTDEAFPLLDDNDGTIPADRYEVDVRRVQIRAAKASVWRGRPKIWPWNLLCWFNFDPRRVELSLVEQIAREAGIYPGLLDGRPESGLWFGTFEVVKVWSEAVE